MHEIRADNILFGIVDLNNDGSCITGIMLFNDGIVNIPILVTVFAVDATYGFHAITNKIAAAAKASMIVARITAFT